MHLIWVSIYIVIFFVENCDSNKLFDTLGRVPQVDYASKAAKLASCSLAIRCKDGTLMASKRWVARPAKMRWLASERRVVHRIDSELAACVVGIPGDCRLVIQTLQKEAENYRSLFGEPIPASLLADTLANFVHELTLVADTRPLGVFALLISHDEIYQVDTSGAVRKHREFVLWNAPIVPEKYLTVLKGVDWFALTAEEAGKTLKTLWDGTSQCSGTKENEKKLVNLDMEDSVTQCVIVRREDGYFIV